MILVLNGSFTTSTFNTSTKSVSKTQRYSLVFFHIFVSLCEKSALNKLYVWCQGYTGYHRTPSRNESHSFFFQIHRFYTRWFQILLCQVIFKYSITFMSCRRDKNYHRCSVHVVNSWILYRSTCFLDLKFKIN